jgi:hypothetical protein
LHLEYASFGFTSLYYLSSAKTMKFTRASICALVAAAVMGAAAAEEDSKVRDLDMSYTTLFLLDFSTYLIIVVFPCLLLCHRRTRPFVV